MYHYTMCGLDNVWLTNGYVEVDTPYGRGVKIEDEEQLDQVIAKAIVEQEGSIAGKELRFLRQMMCLSQADLAAQLGTTEQTLARWEKDRVDFPATADKLLRVLYSAFADQDAAARDLIAHLNFKDRVKNFRFEFTEQDGHWSTELAEAV